MGYICRVFQQRWKFCQADGQVGSNFSFVYQETSGRQSIQVSFETWLFFTFTPTTPKLAFMAHKICEHAPTVFTDFFEAFVLFSDPILSVLTLELRTRLQMQVITRELRGYIGPKLKNNKVTFRFRGSLVKTKAGDGN